MIGPLERAVVVRERRQRHQKHGHYALHRRRHGVRNRVVDTLRRIRIVERQKYHVVRCQISSDFVIVMIPGDLRCYLCPINTLVKLPFKPEYITCLNITSRQLIE